MKAAKADGASGAAAAIIAIVIGATDLAFAATTRAAPKVWRQRAADRPAAERAEGRSANCGIGAAAKAGTETPLRHRDLDRQRLRRRRRNLRDLDRSRSGLPSGGGDLLGRGRRRCLGQAECRVSPARAEAAGPWSRSAEVTPISDATWSDALLGVARCIHFWIRASSWLAGTSCAATVRAFVQSPDSA